MKSPMKHSRINDDVLSRVNENEEIKAESLDKMEKWIGSQKHISCRTGEQKRHGFKAALHTYIYTNIQIANIFKIYLYPRT